MRQNYGIFVSMVTRIRDSTVRENPVRWPKPRGRNKIGIPERLIARLWQKRAARETRFRTEAGARLRVVYPGRSSGAAGPDFRNALLEIEGVGLVRGDVEIHLRQQDWESHGHSGDPNYNGVVLHAVLGAESPTTVLQSGRQAPVLSMAALLDGLDSPENGLNPELWKVLGQRGYPQPDSIEEVCALLDRAGDDRFLARSAGFVRFLREQGPDQSLYEGLMEGLGYRFNQQPFLKLAMRAPYATLALAGLAVCKEDRAQALESWLLAISGFTPMAATENVPLPRVGFGSPLSRDEWHCFRVRPSNHPRRRISGGAALLDRFLTKGLVAGLEQAAQDSTPGKLISALIVAGGPDRKEALIGRGRAGDLAVNVVLPFLHGLATGRGQVCRSRGYLDLYHRFGKLQENELTREMAHQLMEPTWRGALTNARRQQGLLHLHALLLGGQ